MSFASAASAAYLVASVLFILSLAGLSRHESATRGLTAGVAGMVIALAATVALVLDGRPAAASLALLLIAVVVGGAVGLRRARLVQMTGMPELIALLHDRDAPVLLELIAELATQVRARFLL